MRKLFHKLKNKTVKFLRWSEQYTKTDMIYLAKGGGWLTSSKAFSILIGLILATAFANLIPQKTYGTYKFIVSAASIIGGFTLAGMSTAVTQAAARGFDNALKLGAKTKFKWSIGIVLAGVTAAAYYYLNGNMTLTYGMLMIATLYPLRTSFDLYEDFLQGKKDFQRTSLYKISLEVFQVIVMIATLFLTNNVLWVLLTFFGTNTLAAIYFYFRTKNIYPQADKKDDQMVSFGKHLSVMKLFRKIARHIDKVLIWHFLGPAQLAIYSFATLPVSKIQTASGSIPQVALPKFTEKNLRALRKTLDYKVFLLALLFLGLSAVYILTAPYIFELLFPAYMSSVPFTQVYALGIVLFSGQIYSQTLVAHSKTKWIYITQITSNVVKIASLVVLLPLLGVWGGIISLLAWRAAKALFSYIGFRIS